MKGFFILFAILGSFMLNAQEVTSQQPLVMVTGEGIVKVVPDQVIIRSRIEHEGDEAEEVKKLNDEVVNAVIKYLKAQGVSEENIQTNFVTLNKNYNYNDKTYSYAANQSISIKLEDLKNYETIMSGLLDVGLNRIDGIQFESSEIEKYETEARKGAILDAKKKAEEYVEPLNQNIGSALRISEMEMNNVSPVYRVESMKASSDSGGQETLAPGQLEVTKKVTVWFQLR